MGDMTRALAAAVQKDVSEAISGVLEKHGLTLGDTRGSFTERDFKLSLNFSMAGRDSAKEDFESMAGFYGLEASDFNRTFKDYSGSTYQIVGLKPRARKNTIIVQKMGTDSRYVMPHQSVSRYLEHGAA